MCSTSIGYIRSGATPAVPIGVHLRRDAPPKWRHTCCICRSFIAHVLFYNYSKTHTHTNTHLRTHPLLNIPRRVSRLDRFLRSFVLCLCSVWMSLAPLVPAHMCTRLYVSTTYLPRRIPRSHVKGIKGKDPPNTYSVSSELAESKHAFGSAFPVFIWKYFGI